MSEAIFPCPFTSEPCQDTTCGITWCARELDMVSKIEHQEAELDRLREAGDALRAVACSCHGDAAVAALALWEDATR